MEAHPEAITVVGTPITDLHGESGDDWIQRTSMLAAQEMDAEAGTFDGTAIGTPIRDMNLDSNARHDEPMGMTGRSGTPAGDQTIQVWSAALDKWLPPVFRGCTKGARNRFILAYEAYAKGLKRAAAQHGVIAHLGPIKRCIEKYNM